MGAFEPAVPRQWRAACDCRRGGEAKTENNVQGQKYETETWSASLLFLSSFHLFCFVWSLLCCYEGGVQAMCVCVCVQALLFAFLFT